eukprot:scaffold1582_cov143-Skeletonema_dohrnii-CCMP3373.AAC.15
MRLFDALSTRVVDRQPPSESLLATFGLENSMRSGGVIMVVMILLVLDDVWWQKRGLQLAGKGSPPILTPPSPLYPLWLF